MLLYSCFSKTNLTKLFYKNRVFDKKNYKGRKFLKKNRNFKSFLLCFRRKKTKAMEYSVFMCYF